jgi:hypothetical protein
MITLLWLVLGRPGFAQSCKPIIVEKKKIIITFAIIKGADEADQMVEGCVYRAQLKSQNTGLTSCADCLNLGAEQFCPSLPSLLHSIPQRKRKPCTIIAWHHKELIPS